MKYDLAIVYCPCDQNQDTCYELIKNLREQFPIKHDEYQKGNSQIIFVIVTKPEAVIPL